MGKRHLNPEQPQSFYRAFERISVQRRAHATLAQSSAELPRRSAQSPAWNDERSRVAWLFLVDEVIEDSVGAAVEDLVQASQ